MSGVVQGTTVFGVQPEENRSLDGPVFMAYGLLAGFGAWLACWIVTPLRPRAPWPAIVVVTLPTPVTVVNVIFNQARDQECPMRSHPNMPASTAGRALGTSAPRRAHPPPPGRLGPVGVTTTRSGRIRKLMLLDGEDAV